MVIVLSIENITIEMVLTIAQAILVCLMIYGATLSAKKSKEERKEYVSKFYKKIEEIRVSPLSEDKKNELIAMCQDQINKLKKR